MSNRVVLGQRETDTYGLWISKAGKNALTSNVATDFLFRTDMKAAQVVQFGIIPQTSGSFITTDVAIPNLGYRPLVEMQSLGWYNIITRFLSNTLIRFQVAQNGPEGSIVLPVNPQGSASQRYVAYRVWGVPL
ncbi:hypothetical protein C3Y94_026195 [Rhizobium ruizarguesonis]|uniref:hypothetical protein n=1 Tax=Rhizobium ruizarguesonis TaxID=2081791 RepID=UPI00163ACF62|nr:hypothetical protein [Rhizobium ruizarguesonis]MBC2806647.1 hypothetical protein [Rhizobium ruizarguesonis]